MSTRIRTVVLSVLSSFTLLTFLVVAGCDQGGTGDRCNVNLANDRECNDGLTCQLPGSCSQAYCCPTPLASSTDPNCQVLAACAAAADAGASTDADVADAAHD